MWVMVISPTLRPPVSPLKTRYTIYRWLGVPQGRSGRTENLVTTGIRSRTAHPVAQSLYRLSYRAHHVQVYHRFPYNWSKNPQSSDRVRVTIDTFMTRRWTRITQALSRDKRNLFGCRRRNIRIWTNSCPNNDFIFYPPEKNTLEDLVQRIPSRNKTNILRQILNSLLCALKIQYIYVYGDSSGHM